MEEMPPNEGGIFSAVTRMLKTLRDVVENRVELFLVELHEERARLFGALLQAVLGIIFALMAMILVTLGVVVAFWETHRLLVLAVLAAAYAGAAAAVFLNLRTRLQRWRAFSATLDQIKKDRSCFEKRN